MELHNLHQDVKVDKISDLTATGTTLISSGIVDMAGYDCCAFILTLGVPNAGNFITAQEGAQSNMSDAADLAGSKVTPTGGSPAMVLTVVERPPKRYLRVQITRAGITSVIGEIYAIKYRAKGPLPLTNTGAAAFVKFLADPVEGAA